MPLLPGGDKKEIRLYLGQWRVRERVFFWDFWGVEEGSRWRRRFVMRPSL